MGAAAYRSHTLYEVALRPSLAKSFRNHPCIYHISIRPDIFIVLLKVMGKEIREKKLISLKTKTRLIV